MNNGYGYRRQDDLLIAIALTEFSVHYEQADPELSRRAWQLAADRLLEHDVEPQEAVDALEVGK
ncbi:hypothetical protein [Halopiger thermotolerans]